MSADLLPPHELEVAIEQLEAGGRFGPATLLRAAQSGAIAVLALPPAAQVPRRLFWLGKPLAIVITDDFDGAYGPDCWRAMPFVTSWARAAIVQGDVDNVGIYAAATQTTREARRVVLVETTPARAAAWGAAFQRAGVPAMIYLPGAEPRVLPPLRERAP